MGQVFITITLRFTSFSIYFGGYHITIYYHILPLKSSSLDIRSERHSKTPPIGWWFHPIADIADPNQGAQVVHTELPIVCQGHPFLSLKRNARSGEMAVKQCAYYHGEI